MGRGLVLLCWLVGATLALPHPSRPLVPHNAWNSFFGPEGFPSLDISYMSNLRGELMRDFESRLGQMSSALNRKVDQMSSVLEDKISDFSDQYEQLDLSSHLAHVDDKVTEISSGFSLPNFGGNLFEVFGHVRRPWWKGENVCINREMLEDGDLPKGVNITFSGHAKVHMQVSQCREEADLYECTQSLMDDGLVKTARITYSCCPGYKRLNMATFSSTGCQEYQIKPIEETIAGLDGTDFLSLISEHNLMSELANSTVLVPDNQAMDDYYRELKGLESLGTDTNIIYNIDDGLLDKYRRKRELMITEQPDMKKILLGHILPNIIHTKDLVDRSTVATKNNHSSGIRVHVYNTMPERTVLLNCARITSKDHHAEGGMVHVVDKVVQPATHNIAEMLASDAQFSSFRALLDSGELELLSDQKEEFTVFVPTEAAFQKLDPETRRSLFGKGSCGSHILRSHILRSGLCSGLLSPGTIAKVANLQDELLTLVKHENGRIRVNDIDIIVKDIVATNGVIHLIDSLIVPASARPLSSAIWERTGGLLEKLGASATSLTDKLHSLRNVSLFLPSQAALSRLPESLLAELAKDEKRLEEVVMNHVLPGARDQHAFMHNEVLNTLAGRKVHARLQSGSSGLASLGCARIVQHPDKMCGGNIFTVDRLLLPPEGDLHQTLANQPQHSEFKKLMEVAGLSELVEGAHTIFAPVNEAFKKISDSLKKKIFGDKALAEQVVKHHIVPNIVCCHSTPSLFYMHRTEPNIAGDHLHLRRAYNGRLMVNGAGVLKCDVAADNGILHAVDTVILPPELQDRRSKWGLLSI